MRDLTNSNEETKEENEVQRDETSGPVETPPSSESQPAPTSKKSWRERLIEWRERKIAEQTQRFWDVQFNEGNTAEKRYSLNRIDFWESLRRSFTFIILSFLIESSSNSKFRLTIRRLFILSICSILHIALLLWNHLGFYLDDYFFPDWRETSIHKPLFLIGNARSGTTWLHRLLTKSDIINGNNHNNKSNKNIFTTFTSYEILFAVPITWKYLFFYLYKIDKLLCFGAGCHCITLFENTFIGEIQIHPIGLFEAEEDEWLMMHIGLSQLLLFFYPTLGELLNPLVMYDYHPAAEKISISNNVFESFDLILNSKMQPSLEKDARMKVFKYYKECIQRHVYFQQHMYEHLQSIVNYNYFDDSYYDTYFDDDAINVSESTQKNNENTTINFIFVSKNPAFTLRIPSLYATFPDARVVCLLRDPMQSVPSMVSYISQIWHLFSAPLEKYPKADELLYFCKAHYLFPVLHLNSFSRGEHQWAFISYHHLVSDLSNIITLMLDRLYGEEFWNHCNKHDMTLILNTEHALQRAYKSEHKYSFEDCCQGLSEQQLKDSLKEVYEVHKQAFQVPK